MWVERSAGGRSRQPRSQQASQDAEVTSATMGLGQRFGVGRRGVSHLEPQDSSGQVVMAPGPTQVDSDEELASQLNQSSEAVVAVQADSGARHHGRIAVHASDGISQPRSKRLRLVSMGTPVVAHGQSEVLAAERETCAEPFLSRRVVLVPGSPDGTPRSIQDWSVPCASNRFSVLAEPDDTNLADANGPSRSTTTLDPIAQHG